MEFPFFPNSFSIQPAIPNLLDDDDDVEKSVDGGGVVPPGVCAPPSRDALSTVDLFTRSEC